MEPHATVAVWQGPERLTVHDATQGISNVQKRAAAVFGLPRENVRVISRFLGGGFGCKGSPWSHVLLAARAARATGRAVKLVVARQQMFQFVGHRPVTMPNEVWGIGLALEEHTERDPRTGRVVTKDLADYHLPVNADVPRIEVAMIDEEDPHVNDVGAKGIGEIGIVGVAAAIANAVYHATGRRIRELPITVEKLL